MSPKLLDVCDVDGGQGRPIAHMGGLIACQIVCNIDGVDKEKFDVPNLTLIPFTSWACGDSLESPSLLHRAGLTARMPIEPLSVSGPDLLQAPFQVRSNGRVPASIWLQTWACRSSIRCDTQLFDYAVCCKEGLRRPNRVNGTHRLEFGGGVSPRGVGPYNGR